MLWVKITAFVGLLIYAIGFVLMFMITTQLPNTFGLALLRSAAWPISIIRREVWPKGSPLPMDMGTDEDD